MMIYFAGCMATYRVKSIAKTTIEILKRANLEFKLLGKDEWCCGSVLLRTGDVDIARKMLDHNLEVFEKAGADRVLTSCAGCYRTIKKDYKELAGPLGFEVIHFSELVKDLVAEGKLKFPPSRLKVTYHDPCHLARHMGVYDAPREVLKNIEGLELIEMERSRENARCCGAGGGLTAAFKSMAKKLAERRLQDAEKTAAAVLTTACPFCTYALKEVAERTGSKLEVLDLSEFLVKLRD